MLGQRIEVTMNQLESLIKIAKFFPEFCQFIWINFFDNNPVFFLSFKIVLLLNSFQRSEI